MTGKPLVVVLGTLIAVCGASAEVLVDYQADTLPPPPWIFISNGPSSETSQHAVSVDDGVLKMVDGALIGGNSLGYVLPLALEPDTVIEVEFRARVFSGSSAIDERAPFSVWLHNGAVRADLSVGPDSVTALGPGSQLLLDEPVDGVNWHVYRYRLDPAVLEWWIDGVSLGQITTDQLIQNATTTDRRVNMLITSAAADVELDFLVLDQSEIEAVPAVSGVSAIVVTIGALLLVAWTAARMRSS